MTNNFKKSKKSMKKIWLVCLYYDKINFRKGRDMELALVIILVVLVVALFVISYMKRKKFNADMAVMRDDLKKGDKVMTDSGVVGEVVDSFTEEEYKYFVLKSGKGEHTGYFTVHANAIYYVFGKDNAEKKDKVVVSVAPKKPVEQPAEEKPEDFKNEEK